MCGGFFVCTITDTQKKKFSVESFAALMNFISAMFDIETIFFRLLLNLMF